VLIWSISYLLIPARQAATDLIGHFSVEKLSVSEITQAKTVKKPTSLPFRVIEIFTEKKSLTQAMNKERGLTEK